MLQPERTTIPEFMVIGAMRAATTTLHRLLAVHPEIGMSREKETDFFVAELNYGKGFEWYRSMFPEGPAIRGETSPNYTKFDVFPAVPERIHRHNPDCKLIYVVRDPIKRAISQYLFWKLSSDAQQTQEEKAWTHIINTSRYYAQSERFLQYFGEDNMLILDFDEVIHSSERSLDRISRFIGVSNNWPTLEPANVNSSSELARMPAWFFRIRRNRLVSDLRRRLPRKAQEALRGVMASGPARGIPELDTETIGRLRAALTEDARKFRGLTRMPFESWTV